MIISTIIFDGQFVGYLESPIPLKGGRRGLWISQVGIVDFENQKSRGTKFISGRCIHYKNNQIVISEELNILLNRQR